MRTSTKKTRPALSKDLIWSDIGNNTKKEEMKTILPFLPYNIHSYRKSNTNNSVQCVEMVKISKTELQISNIKRFGKGKAKIIKNPREKKLFT